MEDIAEGQEEDSFETECGRVAQVKEELVKTTQLGRLALCKRGTTGCYLQEQAKMIIAWVSEAESDLDKIWVIRAREQLERDQFGTKIDIFV